MKESKAKLIISSSFSTAASASASAVATTPPQLPPFDHEPKPYTGPTADQVFQKRKQFLGPSLFHYYQKPVSFFPVFIFGFNGILFLSLVIK